MSSRSRRWRSPAAWPRATVDAVVVGDGVPYAPAAVGGARSPAIGHRERRSSVVLAPGTDRGNEVLAHVAAMLDLPMAANCTVGHARRPGDRHARPLGRQPARGGALHGSPLLAHGRAARRRGRPRSATRGGRASISPRLAAAASRVSERVAGRSPPASRWPTPHVVVSGGRGVGSAEGFAVIEELAALLGGAVGCSRAVTSAGWRPHSDQVGQTGTKISPEIYIACGISGATQHMAGCKGAKKLLAINPDAEASIFASADYAVIGDLHEVVPAISRRDPEGEGRHSLAGRRRRARRRDRDQRHAVRRAGRQSCGAGRAAARAGRPRRATCRARVRNEATIVLGQRKLLQRLGPGLMHAFIFWGFLVLAPTILIAMIGVVDKRRDAPVARAPGLVRVARRPVRVLVLIGVRRRRCGSARCSGRAGSRAATSARPT